MVTLETRNEIRWTHEGRNYSWVRAHGKKTPVKMVTNNKIVWLPKWFSSKKEVKKFAKIK